MSQRYFCTQLWRKLNHRKTLILATLILFIIFKFSRHWKGYLPFAWEETLDTKVKSNELHSILASPCHYPSFVLQERYRYFDPDDPTARARVGPNPQVSDLANFTVIYNFASPKPAQTHPVEQGVEVGQEPQEESEDDDDDEEFSDEAVIEEVEDDEHLTFATHSTHEYLLKNVQRLLRHWPTSQPISLAIFAPGQDFCTATALVSWLWNCQKNVSKQISFHLFFPADYANDVASKTASEGIQILEVDCTRKPLVEKRTFRKSRDILYPANTARNIARSAAKTKFVLNSDIEFVPSPNLAQNFVHFSKRIGKKQNSDGNRKKIVYVVPAFEKEEGIRLPLNKAKLVDLYRQEKVALYHKYICNDCQTFPRFQDWIKTVRNNDFRVPDKRIQIFHASRRQPPFNHWLPIFIGTREEPLNEERLSWEGGFDRSVQLHEMCLNNYRYSSITHKQRTYFMNFNILEL